MHYAKKKEKQDQSIKIDFKHSKIFLEILTFHSRYTMSTTLKRKQFHLNDKLQ